MGNNPTTEEGYNRRYVASVTEFLDIYAQGNLRPDGEGHSPACWGQISQTANVYVPQTQPAPHRRRLSQ